MEGFPVSISARVKVRVFLNGPDAGLTKKITVRESEAPDAKVICVRETRENEAELILGNFAAGARNIRISMGFPLKREKTASRVISACANSALEKMRKESRVFS